MRVTFLAKRQDTEHIFSKFLPSWECPSPDKCCSRSCGPPQGPQPDDLVPIYESTIKIAVLGQSWGC